MRVVPLCNPHTGSIAPFAPSAGFEVGGESG